MAKSWINKNTTTTQRHQVDAVPGWKEFIMALCLNALMAYHCSDKQRNVVSLKYCLIYQYQLSMHYYLSKKPYKRPAVAFFGLFVWKVKWAIVNGSFFINVTILALAMKIKWLLCDYFLIHSDFFTFFVSGNLLHDEHKIKWPLRKIPFTQSCGLVQCTVEPS